MSNNKPLTKRIIPGKRQYYYLEIPGQPGRAGINYFEFGRQLLLDGHASARSFISPILMRMMPGYRASPVFHLITTYYARYQAADARGRNMAADPEIKECTIGVETKENGTVSYDSILKLKKCVVIDHNPYIESPWVKLAFFDAEKTWVTW